MHEQKVLSTVDNVQQAKELNSELDAIKNEIGYQDTAFSLPRVTGSWNQTLSLNSVFVCLEYSANIKVYSSTKRQFLLQSVVRVSLFLM